MSAFWLIHQYFLLGIFLLVAACKAELGVKVASDTCDVSQPSGKCAAKVSKADGVVYSKASTPLFSWDVSVETNAEYVVTESPVAPEKSAKGTSTTSYQGASPRPDGTYVYYVWTRSKSGSGWSLHQKVTVVIDTAAPTVLGVAGDSPDGVYTGGAVVSINLRFSEIVTVTGSPTFSLGVTPSPVTATYVSGSGTDTLVFSYVVGAGDFSADLDADSASALSGAIADRAGNAVITTVPVGAGTSGSLANSSNIIIGGGVTIAFVSISPISPATNSTPTVTLSLSAATQANSLRLYSDASCATSISAAATGVSGNNNINPTVGLNQSTSIYAKANSVAGVPSACTLLTTYVHDNTAPTVSTVTSPTANGAYKAGQVIQVVVTFTEAVTVSGTPRLTLNSGAVVNYSSGSGTSALTFSYTVAAGQDSADLDYAATNSLALNGGTIQDVVANNATLTLASPGAAGSLGNASSIVIDTTVPVITYSSISPTSPGNSQTPVVTISLSEASAASGLRLYSDSGCSTTASGASTGSSGSNNITTSTLTANTSTALYAQMTDVAGNISACQSLVTYVHDNGVPGLTFVSISPLSPSSNQNPVVTVGLTEVTQTGGLRLYSDSGCSTTPITAATTGTTGNNALSLSSSLGANTSTVIYGKATDVAGNSTTCVNLTNYVHDNIAPGVSTFAKAVGQSTPVNAYPVNFTLTFSEDIQSVTLTSSDFTNSGTATGVTWSVSQVTSSVFTIYAASGGQGTLIPTLAASSVLDFAGNANSAGATSAESVTLDATAPTITYTSISPGTSGANSTPSVTFNLSEASATNGLRLYSDSSCSTAISAAATGTSGSNTVTTNALSAGNTTIYGKATDAAGNASSCVNMVTYTLTASGLNITGVTKILGNLNVSWSGGTGNFAVSLYEGNSCSGLPNVVFNDITASPYSINHMIDMAQTAMGFYKMKSLPNQTYSIIVSGSDGQSSSCWSGGLTSQTSDVFSMIYLDPLNREVRANYSALSTEALELYGGQACADLKTNVTDDAFFDLSNTTPYDIYTTYFTLSITPFASWWSFKTVSVGCVDIKYDYMIHYAKSSYPAGSILNGDKQAINLASNNGLSWSPSGNSTLRAYTTKDCTGTAVYTQNINNSYTTLAGSTMFSAVGSGSVRFGSGYCLPVNIIDFALAAPTAGNTSMSLSWSGGSANYSAYAYNGTGCTGGSVASSTGITGTSVTLTGLTAGTQYSFIVKDANGSVTNCRNQSTTGGASGTVIFVSSFSGGANLIGGLSNADLKCQTDASNASLANSASFKALLSSKEGSINAKDRVSISGAVVDTRPSGMGGPRTIASGAADLFDGSLNFPVEFEAGGALLSGDPVWTGSSADGNIDPAAATTCGSWTSGVFTNTSTQGLVGYSDTNWLQAASVGCNYVARIYCVGPQ